MLARDRSTCEEYEGAMADRFFGMACLSAVESEWDGLFGACPEFAAYVEESWSETTREFSAEPANRVSSVPSAVRFSRVLRLTHALLC